MGRRARKCYLCSTEYEYCSTCSQDKLKPAWMATFHSEDCKKIFDICTRFNLNIIDKATAQKELADCDLSGKDEFKSYIQRDLEKIFAKDTAPEAVKED